MQARNRLVVLQQFQRWFLGTFVAYTAGFLAVFGAALFLWFRIMVSELNNIAGLLSDTFKDVIDKHIILGIWVSVGFVVLLLCVAALQALLFSRRIAGPLYNIARSLEKMEESGRLQPIKLRRADLFMDLAEKFNRVVEKVNGAETSTPSILEEKEMKSISPKKG